MPKASTPKKTKKRQQPLESWTLDATFWAAEVTVRARGARDARKKALAKLRKRNITRLINPNATFLINNDR